MTHRQRRPGPSGADPASVAVLATGRERVLLRVFLLTATSRPDAFTGSADVRYMDRAMESPDHSYSGGPTASASRAACSRHKAKPLASLGVISNVALAPPRSIGAKNPSGT